MMSTPSKMHRTSKTASITAGLLLGMVAGTFVAPAVAAGKAKVEPLAAATEEQQAAAERVLYGKYQCDAGKTLSVARDTQNPGYVKLDLAKQSWTMKPVLSSTGAIRLEDIKDTTLLIQILNKSMLMNKKSGQRMVDGCMHEAQKAAVEELKKNPTNSSVFDAPAPAAQ